MPVPQNIACEFMVCSEDAATVFVTNDGKLDELLVGNYQPVQAAQPIARLSDVETVLSHERQLGHRHRIQAEINTAKLLRSTGHSDLARVRVLRAELESVRRQIEELESVRDDMLLRSPRDGYVMPVWRAATSAATPDDLETWDRWALDAENRATLASRLVRFLRRTVLFDL